MRLPFNSAVPRELRHLEGLHHDLERRDDPGADHQRARLGVTSLAQPGAARAGADIVGEDRT